MSIRTFRAGMSYILSLSLVLVTPAPLLADRPKNSVEAGGRPDWNLAAMQDYDPALKEFATAPFKPVEPFTITANDPVLDEDPYFLGSQTYKPGFADSSGGSTAFRADSRSLEIQIPGAQRALRIEQPLAPLFELENFLFLQARDVELFKAKSNGEETYGEGLFFIDKNYIRTELRKRSGANPVPIFFIPLEGKGWTEKIHRLAIGPLTTVALQTETGERETLDLIQIRDLAKILHSQVVLATIVALKHDENAVAAIRAKWRAAQGGTVELPFIRLPRGATAAFGFFYTGLDLDHPANGLFRLKESAAWDFSVLPQAHASDLLTPDVLERLATVSWITLSTLGLGWLAQHTVLKKRMLERRAYVEAKEDEVAAKEGQEPKKRDGLLFKAKREVKETVDVFSHGLAALASTPGVATGFALEYGADKFMGKTGRNGLVRWFLEKTFLYGRKQNEWIMVSASTFVLGVMVLGGIDTLSVVLQLLFVSPIFFPWVGSFISPQTESYAREQFSGAHEATNNIVTSEIMRNITGYVVHGAYSYSSSQRAALLEIVRPEVERQMRNEHKEPSGAEYERRIEARLELMLVERGLPSKKEFLFSGPSLMRGLAGLLGYKVDRDRLYDSPDYKPAGGQPLTDEEKALLKDKKELTRRVSDRLDRLYDLAAQYPENSAEVTRFKQSGDSLKKTLVLNAEKDLDYESFVLEKARWGVLSHALKRAVSHARELVAIYPKDQNLKDTLRLLEETKRKYHFVIESIKRPWKVVANVKDAIQVRKMMTVLSYEGEVVGEAVKYLDLWDESVKNPEAARAAGRIYRQSLFGLIQNRHDFLRPTEGDLVKYLPEARAEADQALNRNGDGEEYDETDREILALEIVKAKVQKERAQKKAETWQPPKVGVMESFQRGHAHREAMVQVAQKMDVDVAANPALEMALASGQTEWINEAVSGPMSLTADGEKILVDNREVQTLYREEYRKALAEVVGLEVLPPEESQLVRKAMAAADKEVDVNLENNPGWKEYLSNLDELGRIRFLTHQYADSFLGKYVEMTVSNSSEVSLTSPEQPGFFQKLRQHKWLQQDNAVSRALKVVLRGLESPMDNTAYRPGLSNWLRRNIPWYQDAKTDVQLTARVMWTSLTIGYLTQYYIWQVKFGWSTALLFLLTGGITTIIHYWTDRIMMNVGIRPMSDIWSKVKYSLIYTWLTYPSYLPFFFMNEGFTKWWSRYVQTPLADYLVNPVVSACEKLLSAIF